MLKPFVERNASNGSISNVVVEPVLAVDVEVVPDCNDPDYDCHKTVCGPDSLSNNSAILANLDSKLSHLNSDQIASLKSLISRYEDVFSDKLGRTNVLYHDVDVGNARPVKQSPYRLNPVKREVVNSEVKYMLDNGLIEPSFSSWSSPVVLVKKSNGQPRLCFDYRKVNQVTKSDSYPLPRVDDCIDRIGHSKFISKFDLLKGYWQVLLSRRARKISAFVTSDGFYECKVMPFGMKNAAATFAASYEFCY